MAGELRINSAGAPEGNNRDVHRRGLCEQYITNIKSSVWLLPTSLLHCGGFVSLIGKSSDKMSTVSFVLSRNLLTLRNSGVLVVSGFTSLINSTLI